MEIDTSLEKKYFRHLMQKFIVSLVIGVDLFVLDFVPFKPSFLTQTGQWIWLVISFLTALTIAYAAGDFYKNAYRSFKNHHATMDTLITLGTASAWLYSVGVILFPHSVPSHARHVYFETALIIIAFINLGAALEVRARGKTSAAIQRLIGLQATTVNRLMPDGSEVEVLIEHLIKGDLIRIRPGEKIPVDGVITTGHSLIDESMLTGESMPAQKQINDHIFAGTLNQSGTFIFRATQIGKDTTLARIIQFVQNAQGTKPPITKLTDVVAAYFVPAVLIFAIITALIWINIDMGAGFPLITSMAVLVIACPCALGLAAPISVIVGIGKCATHGILIRHGEALQTLSDINVIVFDKTGSITLGKPQIISLITDNNFDQQRLLELAASVEQYSEHPLGQAIVTHANHQKITLSKAEHFEAISGFGAKATINQQRILLGNANLMRMHHISVTHFAKQATQAALLAQTPIYMSVDQKAVGMIMIADPIKPDAKQAIEILQNRGFEVIMVTGDHLQTAEAIAKQVGIATVFAECLPEEKANKIKQLQNMHKKVVMIGDGINDAPALTQADVGIAMSAGTDIAIESADVTLINYSLFSIIQAIEISKRTMRNIKQNLFGAFIYNLLGLPIAAGILYPFFGVLLNPMIAGAAMALSSLTVVSNANRLRSIKIEEFKS